MKRIILSFVFIVFASAVMAQISVSGSPLSSHDKKIMPPHAVQLEIPKILPKIQVKNTGEPIPRTAGYTLTVNDSILNQGIWQKADNGIYVWQLALSVPNAQALNLYFEDFHLNPGDRLFIYNADKSSILGAFTNNNNGKYFATGLIQSSEISIELDSRTKYNTLPFNLVHVGNIFGSNLKSTAGFGDAGSCEVPVNCSEGNNYQNQKRGVARILLKAGSYLYWCTGSLINDTKNDGSPYFLTANHCGSDASSSDYAQWLFYFNFESPNCSRPATEPSSQTMSGATLLASAVNSTSLGSDFKLLKLNNDVPYSYNPFYNGWNATGTGSSSGVTIHHPEGDIKMISTYTTALVPVNYATSTVNNNGLFWQVHWAQTTNGHGVTEPGSSGAPLFNSQGQIIGTLTGGDAACNALTAPDYYGRFSKSWDQNGTDSTRQLKYWLDRLGTGANQLAGYDPNSQAISAYFSSNIQTVPIGGTVQFINLSTGPITSYHWVFEGGNPSSSNEKDPPLVTYDQSGTYSVSLTVTGENDQQTKTESAYISVKPTLYPNPATDGKLNILLGTYNESEVKIEVYNMLGQKINIFTPEFSNIGVNITIPDNQNGLYFVRLTNNNKTHVYKVMNVHK
ncbi:MAG: T9SS type A sorting domain-containing protein [Bacteroidales bacterium]|nr:T9SS type A sorting domain-containing protein [Bacteroidales bacterium]